MKTNLVLSAAALLAVVACSKKTPEADQTNITSGTQEQATQVAPATPEMAAAPSDDALKDGGHVNAAWKKDGGHVDSFGAGYGSDKTGADSLPSGIGTPIENTQSTTTTTTTTQPMKQPAKPPVDNNKVHGNGTTPGTTGGLNNGQGGSR